MLASRKKAIEARPHCTSLFLLLIAALGLMGFEALYALYQLAHFFLWTNFLFAHSSF